MNPHDHSHLIHHSDSVPPGLDEAAAQRKREACLLCAESLHDSGAQADTVIVEVEGRRYEVKVRAV